LARLNADHAPEDQFHALYNAILNTWFSTSNGYLIDHQILYKNLKPEYVVVKRVGRNRNPLLIVELKRPSRWTTAGRRMVMRELLEYAESRFSLTQYGTIYLLGGIGLHWKVWKMEKTGSDEPTVVVDWQENISSNQSYGIFQTIAGSMYGIN
jgi:hypothetical protein